MSGCRNLVSRFSVAQTSNFTYANLLGPVISINLAGKPVVILGTAKAAADLFGG